MPSVAHQRDPGLEPVVLAGLSPTSMPVLLLVAQDPEGSVFGSPWFAMEWVAGAGIPDQAMASYTSEGGFAESSPDRRAARWNDFVDRLAGLHTLQPDVFGSAPRGGTHSQVLDYWTASLQDAVSVAETPVQHRALR